MCCRQTLSRRIYRPVFALSAFRPLLFNKPGLPPDAFSGVPRGRMLPDQVLRLLRDVARACDVVGLAITEHLPWETLAMRNMLR